MKIMKGVKMPIYEFECKVCNHIIEQIYPNTAEAEGKSPKCPKCLGETKKIISGTTFLLKGIGWGADGYENKK